MVRSIKRLTPASRGAGAAGRVAERGGKGKGGAAWLLSSVTMGLASRAATAHNAGNWPPFGRTKQETVRGNAMSATAAESGLLDRDRIVARPGFNRWLVPPAALAIHLCIGMAYGFSVFWLPLSRAIGISKPVACPADMTLLGALVTTSCDWRVADLGWMFTLFFVFLGSSAALWGGWLERAGPRSAGVVAALCWCGGLLISAVGVLSHQLWMLWLGSGRDRRHRPGAGLYLAGLDPDQMVPGPARHGHRHGDHGLRRRRHDRRAAGQPADDLFPQPDTRSACGRPSWCMAAIYFVFMLGGAFGYRMPPLGWRPEGWTPPAPNAKAMITHGHVHLRDAHRTPQFWLIWAVLCLNVSAGIGVHRHGLARCCRRFSAAR